MNCKLCGGNLSFTNNAYRCDNCGMTFSLYDVYEKVDVCICCQENDENGRRTKDSIISQDIYNRFAANKINAYYPRISAGEITGDDLERATLSAILSAKVIVIVGTTKERFAAIYHRRIEQHIGKIIIPVFSEMNAYDIPKNISAIQGLDYNKIGADVDLIKGVLNALGREEEAASIGDVKNNTTKRNIIVVVTLITLTVCLIVFFLFYKFVIDVPGETIQEPENIITQSDQYNSAISHFENGKLLEALCIFGELSGYKDSDKQRQLIFDKYSGYYKTNDISLHLQTYDNFNSNIELSFLINGNIVKITESILLGTHETSFEFIDSENNFGNATIKFTNEGLIVIVTSTQKNSNLFINDQEIQFTLAEKSDKPIINLDAETVLSWVKKATTIEDVRRLGYEVTLLFSSDRFNIYAYYEINNTDIILTAIAGETQITSIVAPAEFLVPDKIGVVCDSYLWGDVWVRPNAELVGNTILGYAGEDGKMLTDDSLVQIITKASLGDYAEYVWIYE